MWAGLERKPCALRPAPSGCGCGGPPWVVKVVEFLEFLTPDGHSDCKLTMKVEVGRLGGPAADGLAEGCQDIQVEVPEAPRRPLGNGG